MRVVASLSLFALLIFSSCRMMSNHSVKGDGNVVNQARTVRDFEAVEVSSAIELIIRQGSAYEVKVETDNNLQQYVETVVEGRKLIIRQQNNTDLDASNDRIRVYVTSPVFKSIEASGACEVKSEGNIADSSRITVGLSGASNAELTLTTPRVHVDMSGACGAKLKGQTRDLDVEGSGSCTLRAFELLAENATVDISGAGDVQVYASVKLKAGGSGASSIEYKGSASVSTDVSGASSVKKVD